MCFLLSALLRLCKGNDFLILPKRLVKTSLQRYNGSNGGDKVNGISTIYHGSQKTIRTPALGTGNPRNDYGLGFYCTKCPNLAKE